MRSDWTQASVGLSLDARQLHDQHVSGIPRRRAVWHGRDMCSCAAPGTRSDGFQHSRQPRPRPIGCKPWRA